MIELLKALQAKFNASPLAGNFAKGLEFGQAADKEAFPYCVLVHVMNGIDQPIASDLPRVDVDAQFSIWQTVEADGANFLLTAAKDFFAAFHHQAMTLTGEMLCRAAVVRQIGPYLEDERVWKLDLFYKFSTV